MEYRDFGASGLRVSTLAYGAMGIAQDPGLEGGVAPSLLAALDAGVTLVDTARAYRDSETIIRRTLAEWPGERPVISTKLMPGSRDAFRWPAPLETSYTPASIRASVDGSLAALGVERLDIVHLHQWHHAWTHDPAWRETLFDLHREGKVGLVAVSAQDHEHDALLEAVSAGYLDGAQVIVNLFESRPLNAFLPLAVSKGVGVIARCALDSGGLSGLLGDDDFATRPFLKRAPVTEYRARAAALTGQFVPEAATDLADLAIRFGLSAPGVSSVTLGMNSNAFVASAVASAARGALDDETMDAIRKQHVWSKNFYEGLA